ncbi:MAG: hypothetical protein NTY09_12700, partial [bacterium]|nr:hypothetical protein [bacterium]
MKLVHLTLILFGISLLIGCSGARNPIVPQNSESQPLKAESADSSNHAIIGCGELSLNSETGEAEIIPSRDTEFHLNLAKPMMNTMGISMELVPGASDPAIGLFVLDISLTHPLPGYPEFSGFDMKFILMTPGTLNVDGLMFARMEETQLLNRDGLTRWWNPTEFTNPGFLGYYPGVPGVQNSAPLTATVNPYKLYADSLTAETPVSEVAAPSLDSPEGRAIFKSGEENTRRFEIKFPVNGVPVIIFNYAIDVCWDVPS